MGIKIIKPQLGVTVHTKDGGYKQQDLSYGGNANLDSTTDPALNPKHDYVANPVTYEDPDENNFFFPELEEVFPDADTRYTEDTDTPATSAPTTSAPITNTNTYGDFLAIQEKSTNDYYTKLLQQYEEQNKALIAQINKNKAEALSYAEGQKRAAEEAAKIQRERDMVDAANAYEKNKATYGTKAEALADMGLTGGGYSDHLDAQAYAAQRGDVQAAIARHTESNRLAKNAYNDAYYQINSDANKAILDAQNTTNQLKNAAEANKHSELTAIESNKATYNESAFQSVLEGINNGTISESQIENLASLYGMSDSQKQAWLDAANKVAKDTEKIEAEAEANYKSGIFNDILGKISSGAISADQIENLANMYGMSDEQKQIWLDAASKYGTVVEEETKNTSTVTTTEIMNEINNEGYYTSDILERLVTTGQITEDDKKYIEAYQSKAITDRLDYYQRAGNVADYIAYADKMYASKLIDTDTYQSAYFNATLNNCKNADGEEEVNDLKTDIDNLVREGKLNSSDAESLKSYLESFEKPLVLGAKNIAIDVENGTAKITVGGKSAEVYMSSVGFSDKEKKELNEMVGAGKLTNGTFIMEDKQVYVYENGKWYRFVYKNKQYTDEFAKAVNEEKRRKTPTHTK